MTESKKLSEKRKRIWVFRIFLILSPFLLFILLFGLAEIGARIYYSVHGQSFGSYQSPKPSIQPPPASATASQFSIPTTMANKAHFQSPEVMQSPGDTDGSDAYMKFAQIQDVFVMPANASKRLIRRQKDSKEVIYDVLMETDRIGRRITPDTPGKKPSRHLIFFGCSYTLGEGVEQNETLPYFTAAASKNYRSYNLGINGGTVSNAWAFTRVLDYYQDIPEQKGYGIYIFFEDHIPRYKGNIGNISQWLYAQPLVRVDSNGEVHFLGSWARARPFTVGLSFLLGRSYLLKSLRFNFPPVRQQDLEDFVKVVKSVRQGYWDRFGSENPFIFVLYMTHSQPYADLLKPLLEKEQIQYLDYSQISLNSLSNSTVQIPYDGHPNALAHKIVGEQIAEDLNLQ